MSTFSFADMSSSVTSIYNHLCGKQEGKSIFKFPFLKNIHIGAREIVQWVGLFLYQD